MVISRQEHLFTPGQKSVIAQQRLEGITPRQQQQHQQPASILNQPDAETLPQLIPSEEADTSAKRQM
ncbi:hypothetical protein XANCAGTX0491_007456 [Xanthoria calcicola]